MNISGENYNQMNSINNKVRYKRIDLYSYCYREATTVQPMHIHVKYKQNKKSFLQKRDTISGLNIGWMCLGISNDCKKAKTNQNNPK